ncbi:LpqN/LpqT family lipoprotein [Rhodococcus sp. PvR099]|uniref:LpqN/LpqT family lipoprotein n=1 Tax=Rhodococcus sp. PvR099 TaxID=2806602 RepID=UPI001FD72897|nr:LpqN/LpqT family lipoprotein [Rhodococcus sp. PvR099]
MRRVFGYTRHHRWPIRGDCLDGTTWNIRRRTPRTPVGVHPRHYAVEPWNFAATTRYVVTDGKEGQYLTQLTVTTLASQDGDLATDVAVLNLGLEITQL